MGCCYSEFHALCDRQTTDDRITRETLSNNNPCPSSPSSTIYVYIYTQTPGWNLHWFPFVLDKILNRIQHGLAVNGDQTAADSKTYPPSSVPRLLFGVVNILHFSTWKRNDKYKQNEYFFLSSIYFPFRILHFIMMMMIIIIISSSSSSSSSKSSSCCSCSSWKALFCFSSS